MISPLAVFVPTDIQGVARPVEMGNGCHVGPFAVIYGGTVLHNGATLEEHAVVGKPEHGYAVGHVYSGTGAATVVGDGAVVRAGAVMYAGSEIGAGHALIPVGYEIPPLAVPRQRTPPQGGRQAYA
jgi:acetyltransferase-like isoleucine patch superfamily enzyme